MHTSPTAEAPLAKKSRALATGLLLLTVAGCTIYRPLGRNSVDYNKSIERSENEMLFLNIIRAMKRQPMFFSTVPKAISTSSGSLGTGLSVALTPDGKANYGATPSLKAEGRLQADMITLDSQNLVRARKQPVTLEQVDYFLRQGWHPEVLLTLLVESISGDCGDSPKSVRNVSQALRCLGRHVEVQTISGEVPEGPPFYAGEGVAKMVLEGKKADLTVKAIGDRYRFFRHTSSRQLVFCKNAPCEDKPDEGQIYLTRQQLSERERERNSLASPDDGTPSRDSSSKGRNELVLRSPDGIIYRLGEIMRDGGCQKISIKSDKSEDSQDLLFFALRRADVKGKEYAEDCPTPAGKPLLVAQHGGEEFIIPRVPNGTCENRSMQALDLVHQLMGLNRKQEDLPTTGTVTLIAN